MKRLAAIIAIALIAAACSSSPKESVPLHTTHWIVNDGPVHLMLGAGLTTPQATSLFNHSTTYLTGSTDPLLPNASATQSFDSLESLQAALTAGRVTGSYVLLDLEKWQFTPVNEQLSPFTTAATARTLVHQYGKKLIFTPSISLATLTPGTGSRWAQYLSKGFARQGAAVSDVFEIQAQQTEGTPDATTFAPAAVAQARASSIPVLVGLSTNPVGKPVTPAQMSQVALASNADGFWLNVPSTGPLCPTCGPAQPQIAVQFLQSGQW